MADNVRAGINYEIKITGDFEKKLDRFEARVKKLQAESARLSTKAADKSATSADAAQAKSAQARLAASTKALANAKQRLSVEEKNVAQARAYIAMKRQAFVAATEALNIERAKLEVIKAQQRAEIARFKQGNTGLRADNIKAKAEAATLKLLEARNVLIQRYNALQQQAPRSVTESAGILGTTPAKLAAASKSIDAIYQKEKASVVEQKQLAKEAERAAAAQERTTRAINKSTQGAKGMKAQMNGVEKSVHNMLFTFRRLVGILAIFTIARKAAQYIGAAVNEMSDYNSELEQSRIAFASLISATGQMVDDNGNMVTGIDELNKALEISDDLMVKLRKDALSTTATFKELLIAFQFAVGPGLSAGLNLDEIEQTAVNIAKAAGALKVPTNQLGEEIRSLIQGTITLKNTRLAVIGVTNQEIRLAREEGKLFDYLAGKLQTFADASGMVAQTFKGLQSQVQDAVQSLLAQGAEGYFETLKSSMQEFVNALVDQDNITKDNFGFNDEALSGVQAFSGALAYIIEDFRALTEANTIISDTSSILTSIANVMKIVGGFLVPIVVGFGRALSFVSLIFNVVTGIAAKITDIAASKLVRLFKSTLATLSSIVGVVLIWRAVSTTVLLVYRGIQAIMFTLPVFGLAIQKVTLLWRASILAVNSGLTVTQALMIFINGLFSLVSISITAIVVAAVAIAHRFGILAKIVSGIKAQWKKLNNSISESAGGVSNLTNSVKGQLDILNDLEAVYQRTIDKSRQLDSEIKSAELLQGIPKNIRHLYEPLVDAVAGYNKELERANRQVVTITKSMKDLVVTQEAARKKISEIEDELLEPGKLKAESRSLAKQLKEERAVLNRAKQDENKLSGDLKTANAAIAEIERERLIVAEKQVTLSIRKRELGIDEIELAQLQEAAIKRILAATSGASVSEKRLHVLTAELKVLEAQQESIKLAKAEAEAKQFDLDKLRAGVKQGLLDAYKVDLPELGLEHLDPLKHTFEELEASIKELRESVIEADWPGVRDRPTPERDKYIQDLKTAISESLTEYSTEQAAQDREYLQKQADIENTQMQATNDMLGSFRAGMAEFVKEVKTLGESFAEATIQLMEGIGETVGGLAGDAIRGEDVDAKEAFGELLANVVENMVTNLVTTMLQMLISTKLQGLFLNANTVALHANTAALAAAAVTPHYGGRIGRFAHGGAVKAYAPGGGVSHGIGSAFPKPPNTHPRDTVRAWLTPNEHVMTDKASKMFGHDFFDSINAMARGSRSVVSNLVSARALSPIVGRAAGGPVLGHPTAKGPGVRSRRKESPQIVPVMVTSEATGRQLFSGAKDSFGRQVFKVQTSSDLNRSGF